MIEEVLKIISLIPDATSLPQNCLVFKEHFQRQHVTIEEDQLSVTGPHALWEIKKLFCSKRNRSKLKVYGQDYEAWLF